jgi:hypothetical protein
MKFQKYTHTQIYIHTHTHTHTHIHSYIQEWMNQDEQQQLSDSGLGLVTHVDDNHFKE